MFQRADPDAVKRNSPGLLAALGMRWHNGLMLKLALLLMLLATPVGANSTRYELGNTLQDRAKWKSFGVEDWVSGDPIERARRGRGAIQPLELRQLEDGSPVGRLKSLIALAEAGPKGYDAVHTGARIKPPKRPTQMTLREIKVWIQMTPGQPHAIGRYQIIPSTLAVLIRRSGFSATTRFSPEVQDAFADILLIDAGLPKFQKGRISRKRFMNNLARVWAGLPNSSGKSHYDGYAGNRATISYAFFKARMIEFFGA